MYKNKDAPRKVDEHNRDMNEHIHHFNIQQTNIVQKQQRKRKKFILNIH